MYIIKAHGHSNSFNGTYYSDQKRANDEAKMLADSYRTVMVVCKIVEVSLFKPTFYNMEDAALRLKEWEAEG